MSTLTSTIIASVRSLLLDAAGVRWLDAECLSWLTEAELVTVLLKGPANTIVGDMTLIAGASQSPPALFLSLVHPLCNVTGAGVQGKAPKVVDVKTMDALISDWRSATASSSVDLLVVSPEMPKILWVYPPQPVATTQKLSIAYVAKPAAITSVGQAITLADEYVPALTDYLMYRCLVKDSEIPESNTRAAQAMASFAGKLGVSATTATATSARVSK